MVTKYDIINAIRAAMSTNWDYRKVAVSELTDEKLSHLGNLGFELVAVTEAFAFF